MHSNTTSAFYLGLIKCHTGRDPRSHVGCVFAPRSGHLDAELVLIRDCVNPV